MSISAPAHVRWAASYPTRSSFSRLVAGLALLTAACGSPTAPSRDRLEIVAAAAVAPHQSAEVQAWLVGTSGARQDVTARVKWRTSDAGVLSVSAGGRVTGGAVGEATLGAALDHLSASTSVIVVPAGTYRLAGIVRAAGSTSPLAGAHVQLTTDGGQVLNTEAAGPDGFRFYGVGGRARLKVSRRGFHPYDAEIDVHDHLTHDVSLSPTALAGTYTLTLTASNRCRLELPEETRTRTYTATIGQANDVLTVILSSPSVFPGWNDQFTGGFDESGDVLFQFAVEEWPQGRTTQFTALGRMTTTVSTNGLSGSLDGEMAALVTNDDGRGNRWLKCTAADHRVMLSR